MHNAHVYKGKVHLQLDSKFAILVICSGNKEYYHPIKKNDLGLPENVIFLLRKSCVWNNCIKYAVVLQFHYIF